MYDSYMQTLPMSGMESATPEVEASCILGEETKSSISNEMTVKFRTLCR